MFKLTNQIVTFYDFGHLKRNSCIIDLIVVFNKQLQKYKLIHLILIFLKELENYCIVDLILRTLYL